MRSVSVLVVLLAVACANRPGGGDSGRTDAGQTSASPGDEDSEPSPTSSPGGSGDPSSGGPSDDTAPASDDAVADVLAVEVSGTEGGYTFAVQLRSPDTGCDRYADWWEVVDAEGNLLYRRILAHSHVDEQPFTRSGGPVAASANAQLWVRAHMHGEGTAPDGYGGQLMGGTAASGFSTGEATLPALHETPPLPEDCAF